MPQPHNPLCFAEREGSGEGGAKGEGGGKGAAHFQKRTRSGGGGGGVVRASEICGRGPGRGVEIVGQKMLGGGLVGGYGVYPARYQACGLGGF